MYPDGCKSEESRATEEQQPAANISSPRQKRLLQNPFSPNENSLLPSSFPAHLSPLIDFSTNASNGPFSLLASPSMHYDGTSRSPMPDVTPSLSCLMALSSPSFLPMRNNNSLTASGTQNGNSVSEYKSRSKCLSSNKKQTNTNTDREETSDSLILNGTKSSHPQQNFHFVQKLEFTNDSLSKPDNSYWKQREQSSFEFLGFALGPNCNSNDSLSSFGRFLMHNNNSNHSVATGANSNLVIHNGNHSAFQSNSQLGNSNLTATPGKRHLRIVNGKVVPSPEPLYEKSKLPPKANLRKIGDENERGGNVNFNDSTGTPHRKRRAGVCGSPDEESQNTIFGSASKRTRMELSKSVQKPRKTSLGGGNPIVRLKVEGDDTLTTPACRRTKDRAPLSAMARLTMSSPNDLSVFDQVSENSSSYKLRNNEGLIPVVTKKKLDEQQPCNCKKSKCLKLYCDCFAAGLYCTGPCKCLNCQNMPSFEEARASAISTILERNPNAFKPKINDSNDGMHTKGCHCKKSGCLKKYCECFNASIVCGDNCKCKGCQNNDVEIFRQIQAKKKNVRQRGLIGSASKVSKTKSSTKKKGLGKCRENNSKCPTTETKLEKLQKKDKGKRKPAPVKKKVDLDSSWNMEKANRFIEQTASLYTEEMLKKKKAENISTKRVTVNNENAPPENVDSTNILKEPLSEKYSSVLRGKTLSLTNQNPKQISM